VGGQADPGFVVVGEFTGEIDGGDGGGAALAGESEDVALVGGGEDPPDAAAVAPVPVEEGARADGDGGLLGVEVAEEEGSHFLDVGDEREEVSGDLLICPAVELRRPLWGQGVDDAVDERGEKVGVEAEPLGGAGDDARGGAVEGPKIELCVHGLVGGAADEAHASGEGGDEERGEGVRLNLGAEEITQRARGSLERAEGLIAFSPEAAELFEGVAAVPGIGVGGAVAEISTGPIAELDLHGRGAAAQGEIGLGLTNGQSLVFEGEPVRFPEDFGERLHLVGGGGEAEEVRGRVDRRLRGRDGGREGDAVRATGRQSPAGDAKGFVREGWRRGSLTVVVACGHGGPGILTWIWNGVAWRGLTEVSTPVEVGAWGAWSTEVTTARGVRIGFVVWLRWSGGRVQSAGRGGDGVGRAGELNEWQRSDGGGGEVRDPDDRR